MLVRRVAVVALLFLPACGGCSSCIDDGDDPAPTQRSGLEDTPRDMPPGSDSSPTRFIRPPFMRHRDHDGGVKVASDAAIE